jgi:hypothetical protein
MQPDPDPAGVCPCSFGSIQSPDAFVWVIVVHGSASRETGVDPLPELTAHKEETSTEHAPVAQPGREGVAQ